MKKLTMIFTVVILSGAVHAADSKPKAKELPPCNATHPVSGPRPDLDDYGQKAFISNKPCRRNNGEIAR